MTRAIILNGPSSAGKSSIAKALQLKMDGCFLHFQMDAFWDMIPPSVEEGSENFPYMKLAIIDSAKALLKHGHNLIVDIVCMPEQMEVLTTELKEFSPYLVAVTASPDILKKREKDRGDRKLGLAESQFLRVHQGIKYDFEIDTGSLQADESANKILKHYMARHQDSPYSNLQKPNANSQPR